jgi:hypothetical protein
VRRPSPNRNDANRPGDADRLARPAERPSTRPRRGAQRTRS